jgi:hypothetical protein
VTSPVAVVTLTYDAEDIQRADLGVFLRIVHGLNEPPSVRGTDSIVPALGGRVEGLRKNDVVAIELDGIVQADGDLTDPDDQKASFRANADYVRDLFRTDRARAQLTALTEDGSLKFINARPLNAIWTVVIPGYVATVNIALEGYDDWAEVEGS